MKFFIGGTVPNTVKLGNDEGLRICLIIVICQTCKRFFLAGEVYWDWHAAYTSWGERR